jgi:hypothetical protein
MKTITDFGSTFSTSILDFMDKAPGAISLILTIVIIVGYWLLG